MRVLSVLLVGAVMLLGGCGLKTTTSHLYISQIEKTAAYKGYDEADKNYWRDCFNEQNGPIKEDYQRFLEECFTKEISDIEPLVTLSEANAIIEATVLCTTNKLWSKHKDNFSLDKNMHNKNMVTFCQEVKESYEKY